MGETIRAYDTAVTTTCARGRIAPYGTHAGFLDIRSGAGNAKNGEGERLGVAIRGDDVRFARQHDRLQFAGGVDECECIAHIGFSMIQCYAPRPQV